MSFLSWNRIKPGTTHISALMLGLLLFLAVGRAGAYQQLLVNGDFESGYASFESDCLFKPGGFLNEAQFDVTTDPLLVHNFSGTYSYPDHTTGAGKMMVINGTTDSSLRIWNETVLVAPNQNYEFSGWVSSWRGAPFSNLRLSVNGVPILDFSSPSSPASWHSFNTIWNSGGNTSAALAIYDLSTEQAGNDFALDDLSFVIPEPTSISLVACFGITMAALGRRRRRNLGFK